MGICYVFKDSKITKDDGTLIKRGVHYGWGATPDDSNVSENNKGLSQAISSQNVDGNLIGLNRNPLLFWDRDYYGDDFEEVMKDAYGKDWEKYWDDKWKKELEEKEKQRQEKLKIIKELNNNEDKKC